MALGGYASPEDVLLRALKGEREMFGDDDGEMLAGIAAA
jgi:hypothetical protein